MIKLLFSLLAACSLPAFAADEEENDSMIPLNRAATTEALSAFQAGDYKKAIASANECIQRFKPSADGVQRSLEGKKAVLPVGAVSAEEKQRIGQYEILHDVARCLLIAAWSDERLGRKTDAEDRFRDVQDYTFARLTDDNITFWAPAQLASGELKRLGSK